MLFVVCCCFCASCPNCNINESLLLFSFSPMWLVQTLIPRYNLFFFSFLFEAQYFFLLILCENKKLSVILLNYLC
jgi:formate hydrogenlyase subunit 4